MIEVRDSTGLLTAPANQNRWRKIRAAYPQWVLLFGLTWLPVFAWFVPTALPAMLFIWGVPCLVYFGRIRAFWPVAALTFALLLLGFLWSEFTGLLLGGQGLAVAFATKYWFAPFFCWVVAWAVIFTCDAVAPDRTPRIVAWLSWLMVALTVVQIFESFSGMALRGAMNDTFYDGKRSEMLIVRMLNANAYLTLLFWPLAFWFVHRRQYLLVAVLALGVVVGAVASDGNAHLVAMAAAAIVFFTVRYWPRALHRVQPHRLLAILSAAGIIAVPAVIYGLMVSGLAQRIRDDLLPSWAHRIDIWTFTVERSLEKPWFGWGYEASRQFPGDIPLHPHNLSLQAWLEMGLPGLALLAGLWFAIFWLCGPKEGYTGLGKSEGFLELDAKPETVVMTAHQLALPYILAAASGYFVINLVSYGLWRAWYYCLGGVLVAVMLLAIKVVDHQMKLRT